MRAFFSFLEDLSKLFFWVDPFSYTDLEGVKPPQPSQPPQLRPTTSSHLPRANISPSRFAFVRLKNKLEPIVEMTDADTRIILCLPDDHKSNIVKMLESEENKKNGFVHLTDKNGIVMKFYYNQGNLWADRADGEQVISQPVITMTEAENFQRSQRPFKEKLVERMTHEFPEKTPEQIAQDADILNEANESIKRLIASGVAPSVARKIISNVLECSVAPSTPEEISEIISKTITEEEKPTVECEIDGKFGC